MAPRPAARDRAALHAGEAAGASYRQELRQYRGLLAFATVCFFVYACLARLSRRLAHPRAAGSPESVFAEARRQARTVVPLAFMR
jgi:hypothetical protein